MKIAVIHDWLTTYAGAEKVLTQILDIYPNADIYTIVDFLPPPHNEYFSKHSIKTSFIQILPFAKRFYRVYLALMPLAVEQFNLSAYDLVISSSHAVAKGVITGPDQLHISYIHSPIRYAWDLQHQYLIDSSLNKGIKSFLARLLLHWMRIWDTRTSNGVDAWIANSRFISRRIRKIYGKSSTVIYPPVDISSFNLNPEKKDFYLTCSRLVPYKKISMIIDAFSLMPNKTLYVIGDGPEMEKCRSKATNNIHLLGWQPFNVLKDYLEKAKAFVFAAEEDFGISPLEAQACGTPVIAYGKGGALETIRGFNAKNPTGVFFSEQSSESLVRAINFFEENHSQICPYECRRNSERFSNDRFRDEFEKFVQTELDKHQKYINADLEQ